MSSDKFNREDIHQRADRPDYLEKAHFLLFCVVEA